VFQQTQCFILVPLHHDLSQWGPQHQNVSYWRHYARAPHPHATPHQNTFCWGHHTRTSHSGATTPGPLINMPTKPGPLILEPYHQDSSSFIHHTRTSHTGAITPGLLILVRTTHTWFTTLQQYTAIKVKYGEEGCIMGTLLHAKCGYG